MLNDQKIANSISLKPIEEIAFSAGIRAEEVECHGKHKAKISLDILQRLNSRPSGRYIVITAITPTPLGEGKTVNTIGLSLGLNNIGHKSAVCLRQPSLGPVFGIKGGAAGGGWSQVLPMEDINLHFTGDAHAVNSAHNLCAAFLDNHLLRGNTLDIDPDSISWPRVMNVSDRLLRNVQIGMDEDISGFPRNTRFDITEASEVMAILALSRDLNDLRERLGRIFLGYSKTGKLITPDNLKVTGAMTALLKDAIKPNLVQTTEGTPAFIHTGPFGNIAHGNSSIISDRIALKLFDYVVTESGFGADIGLEKFMNIKCRDSGLRPDCAVLVCSIRALKMHSNRFSVKPGRALDPALFRPDPEAVSLGLCNLEKQLENAKSFGVPVVVAINRFETDHEEEIKLIRQKSLQLGAAACVESRVYAEGGVGGRELAKAVVRACEQKNDFSFLYPLETSLKDKIETIARKMYGAASVEYSPLAGNKLEKFTNMGYAHLSICMAKTHLSLSHDPALKGRPRDFILPVRDA